MSSHSQLILKTDNAVLDCFDNIEFLNWFLIVCTEAEDKMFCIEQKNSREVKQKCLVGVNFHEPTIVTFFTLISYMIC